ncbi:D-alanyl-D-alanine carboxypeptidase family protein [Acidithiobacillus sp.]
MKACPIPPRYTLALLLPFTLSCARAAALPPLPTLPPPPPMPAPRISGAQAAVLMDVQSGQVLAAAAPTRELNPSGLVKLMTAYVVHQAETQGLIHADQTVPVSAGAWHVAGSRMFLQPGKAVDVAQLEDGLLIDGGNDAAVALAQAVAGGVGSFVQLMNHDAQVLGLTQTRFRNPDGLPQPGQSSSALDLARLSCDVIRSDPGIVRITSQKSYHYNHITQYNWNPLVGRGGVNGLGVGLASRQHWNLDVSATKDGRTLIAVVLGAPSRSAAAAAANTLLHYGWAGWQDRQFDSAGQTVATLHQQDWSPERLQAMTTAPVTVSIPSGQAHAIRQTFVPAPQLRAPVQAGAAIGTLSFRWHGQVLQTVPVVAKNAVERAGWFTRILHQAESWLG